MKIIKKEYNESIQIEKEGKKYYRDSFSNAGEKFIRWYFVDEKKKVIRLDDSESLELEFQKIMEGKDEIDRI